MSATSYLVREEWRDIKDTDGLYQVSNFGRVKALSKYMKHPTGSYSLLPERILKGTIKNGGYIVVNIKKNGLQKDYLIHRLVAEAFIPNPNNYPVINHKNEKKSDNYFENLEWCTVLHNNTWNGKAEGTAKKLRKRVC